MRSPDVVSNGGKRLKIEPQKKKDDPTERRNRSHRLRVTFVQSSSAVLILNSKCSL